MMEHTRSQFLSATSILEFSFIGYAKQQVTVGNRTIIDVVLHSDSKVLPELIVVGYAAEQKVMLTGSVDVVKSEALKDIPVPTIDGLMQGQASGVQVSQNSGTPGG